MVPYDNDNQFELSYEFLFLLKWLVEHEPEQLKKVIQRATRHGFKEQFNKFVTHDAGSPEIIQRSIVDFLDLLDTLLIEVLHEDSVKKVLNSGITPVINQIDSRSCDAATVQCSLDKASQRMETHPNQDPQTLLFKELLKRWKPLKNAVN
jgi:hypothetical protein